MKKTKLQIAIMALTLVSFFVIANVTKNIAVANAVAGAMAIITIVSWTPLVTPPNK